MAVIGPRGQAWEEAPAGLIPPPPSLASLFAGSTLVVGLLNLLGLHVLTARHKAQINLGACSQPVSPSLRALSIHPPSGLFMVQKQALELVTCLEPALFFLTFLYYRKL